MYSKRQEEQVTTRYARLVEDGIEFIIYAEEFLRLKNFQETDETKLNSFNF